MTPTPQILALCDAGHTPAQIASRLGLPAGKVYAVLRAERPDRTRAPRQRTSGVPAKMLALHGAGVGVARVAELLRCSRAYCYKVLTDAKEAAR